MADVKRLNDVADLVHEKLTAKEGDDNYDPEFDYDAGIEKLTMIEKTITDREKLEVEKRKIEVEQPKEKTRFEKIVDFGKSWGPVIVGGLTFGGVILHEVFNRKNLGDVTEFEETGNFRSTGFRKWIK